MTRVWERLFLGSLRDAEQLVYSNPHCVTTVVSLCEACVASKRRGINNLHLSINEDRPVPVERFDHIMDAIAENIRWGIVLINCGEGVSRAPSFAAAYMDAVGCMGIDAAIEQIREGRTFVRPSRVLLNSLKDHLR